jgi:hypothetical protein
VRLGDAAEQHRYNPAQPRRFAGQVRHVPKVRHIAAHTHTPHHTPRP